MKLLNIKSGSVIKAAIIDDKNKIRDISAIIPLITGNVLNPSSLDFLKKLDISNYPIIEPDVHIEQCVYGVGKIICIGLNYYDHAHETKLDLPVDPVIFLKASSAINGPYNDLIIPKGLVKCDWEVELAIVIGVQGKNIEVSDAKKHVAGYCVINDISERSLQFEGSGQWTKGKSFDGFAPLGPWLVTSDEAEDVMDLDIWLQINEITYQSSNTSQMKKDVYKLISYVSNFMSLQVGDIIATGTPAGVGFGQSPQIYLKHGDIIRAGIESLGTQEIRVIEEEKL